jgi:hypothetical protein
MSPSFGCFLCGSALYDADPDPAKWCGSTTLGDGGSNSFTWNLQKQNYAYEKVYY